MIMTAVPVCPLFAVHLQRYGDEFVAEGGKFRSPTPADRGLVSRAIHSKESRRAGDALDSA